VAHATYSTPAKYLVPTPAEDHHDRTCNMFQALLLLSNHCSGGAGCVSRAQRSWATLSSTCALQAGSLPQLKSWWGLAPPLFSFVLRFKIARAIPKLESHLKVLLMRHGFVGRMIVAPRTWAHQGYIRFSHKRLVANLRVTT